MQLRFTLVLLAVAAVAPTLRAQAPLPLAERESLGQGTPGSAGIPRLRLVGRAAIGEPGPVLRIEGGAPRARALLVIGPGVGHLPLPAFGATLFAQLPAGRFVLGPLDAAGNSEPFGPGPAPLAPALVGLDFVAQGMVLDAAAQGGAAFTAGLRLQGGAGFAASGLFAGLGYRLDPEAFPLLEHVLAAGDFDGNGRPDLVAALHVSSSTGLGKLRLLRQLDDGSFAPPIGQLTDAGEVDDLLPAHIDGDGRLDLLVSMHVDAQSEVHLLHGLGDGRFGAHEVISAPGPSSPSSLAVGDLTGDGVDDLVVTEWIPGALAILPSLTGAPQLVTVPGRTVPGTLRAADLDDDGVIDLALLIESPVDALVVLPGAAGGGFLPWTMTPVGFSDPLSLALGDVDHDGDVDAVAGVPAAALGQAPSPTLYVLSNDGSNHFTTPASPPAPLFTGFDVADVELADLDGDDDPDLVVGQRAQGFSVARALELENLGGSFAQGQDLLALADQAVVTDLDGDGWLDLAGVSQTALDPAVVSTWRGLGDGGFDVPPALPGLEMGTARAADLDGDGDLDLIGNANDTQTQLPSVVVSLWSSPTGFGAPLFHDAGGSVSVYDGLDVGDADADGALDVAVAGGGSLRLLRGDGAGGLQPSFTLPVSLARSPRIADVDADGRPDLVVSAGNAGLHVLLGQPAGGFAAPVVTPSSPTASVYRYALGDLDGDGLLDGVVQGGNGFHLFRGTGGGHFTTSFVPDPGSGAAQEQPLVLADLDGDGDLDLARSEFLSLEQSVWRNDGSGTFSKGQSMISSTWIRLAAADVNGDGTLDLLGNEVSLGFGDGTFAPSMPSFGAGAIGDFDGDGDVDSFVFGWLFENRSF